jgi:hypothetical protein
VNDKGANFLESHEAHLGTSVGVLDGRKRTGKGRVGTIERTYGYPNYLAVDVRFEDGSVELYWYHELRTMAERGGMEASNRVVPAPTSRIMEAKGHAS